MRTAQAAGASAGAYVFHCAAAGAIVYEETRGELCGATAVRMPVLLLMQHALLALSNGGAELAAALPLAGACHSSCVLLHKQLCCDPTYPIRILSMNAVHMHMYHLFILCRC